jgi:hypothetical protein
MVKSILSGVAAFAENAVSAAQRDRQQPKGPLIAIVDDDASIRDTTRICSSLPAFRRLCLHARRQPAEVQAAESGSSYISI